MSRRKADLIAGIVSIIVALVFGIQGRELSFLSNLFPLTLEAFLVLSGVALLVRGFLSGEGQTNSNEEKLDYGRGWLVIIASLVYVAAINFVGFYVSSFVFLTLLSWFLGDRRWNLHAWGISSLFGLVVTGILYVAFWLFLKVPAPQGILF